MRIHAYVLAADPTWVVPSVSAYYPYVDKIVVSYDETGRGWTGAPVRVNECLSLLRSLDRDGKLDWAPGTFATGAKQDPMAAETGQRREAFERAAVGADWVLQIDTDEVLPRWQPLLNALDEAQRRNLSAVEWPMRVLFRRLRGEKYLEFATAELTPQFTYPGPIAVRPHVDLVEARRTRTDFLRACVRGDRFSVQVRRPTERGEHRVEMVAEDDAIWHNSWARTPAAVREKLSAWGHNEGFRTWVYYYAKWLPAPLTWRLMRQAHSLGTLPSRLRISPGPPSWMDD